MQNILVKNLIVDFETGDDDNKVTKKRVLNGINFSVNEGEFICIIGKNGSGKSTLAKTLNGLLQPTEGTVNVYGYDTKDVDNIIDLRKNIGIAFQNPDNQIVASIVEEDVAFGLENISIEPIEMEKRIDEALKCLSILDLKYALISKLSGGQKQKVAIAGILAMKSKIIILDEPTSMIDKKGRDDLIKTLKRLNKEENITIIMISHFTEEIFNADRVIVLDKGNIEYDGNPHDFISDEDIIKRLDIELPYVSRMAYRLKDAGYNLKGDELTACDLCHSLV